jgi:hypothetical protein
MRAARITQRRRRNRKSSSGGRSCGGLQLFFMLVGERINTVFYVASILILLSHQ